MLARNARAGVTYGDAQAACWGERCLQGDVAACRGIAHGIAQQVADGAAQFLSAAHELQLGIDGAFQRDVVRNMLAVAQYARERFGIVHALLQQLGQLHVLARIGLRAAFQPGEHEQIVHQQLHAMGLFGHQVQIVLLFAGVQRKGLQGFYKADQYGQWCADFVRDVGHKVAPHAVSLFQQGHVAR